MGRRPSPHIWSSPRKIIVRICRLSTISRGQEEGRRLEAAKVPSPPPSRPVVLDEGVMLIQTLSHLSFPRHVWQSSVVRGSFGVRSKISETELTGCQQAEAKRSKPQRPEREETCDALEGVPNPAPTRINSLRYTCTYTPIHHEKPRYHLMIVVKTSLVKVTLKVSWTVLQKEPLSPAATSPRTSSSFNLPRHLRTRRPRYM